MDRFDGQAAIITGGARGTGEATVRRFVEEGARVLLVDLLEERGEALAEELGPDVAFRRADVTDATDWAAVTADVQERWGRCDTLVNNAAILHLATVEHSRIEDVERVMAVNFLGPFLGIQACLPLLRESKGSIVNVGSTDSFSAFPATGAYTSSKFALRGLTKAVALEEAQHGVRCNIVCPGTGNLEMIAESFARAEITIHDDVRSGASGDTALPLGRPAELFEIAAAIAFFASADAGYCTGTELLVDGGHHAGTMVEVPGIFRVAPPATR